MATTASKLAVILHADVVGSTALVRKDERLAHDRIQAAFQSFSAALQRYGGTVHEVRGDALVAEFPRASDAILGALSAQQINADRNANLANEILPEIRVGIALGEVVIADDTVTGAGVVLAQRLEQLARAGVVCVSAAVREAVPDRIPLEYTELGVQRVKGFDEPVAAYSVSLPEGVSLPDPSPTVPDTVVERPRRRGFAALLVVLIVLAAGVFTWLWIPDVEPADPDKYALPLPEQPSLAVLPFDNFSADSNQDFFADGITESIITALAKVPGLFVIARNSTFVYKGKSVSIKAAAEQLGVRYVLEGSVKRSGDQVQITTQLIDALSGRHIWAEKYDRKLDDILAIQDDIARHVAIELNVKLAEGPHAKGWAAQTSNAEAFDLFLQGYALTQDIRRGNYVEAAKLFDKALELDPNFAMAKVQLGVTYYMRARYRWASDVEGAWQKAGEILDSVLEADPQNPDALIARGSLERAARRYDEAVKYADKAVSLDPNNAHTAAMAALYYNQAGQPAEGLALIKHAMRLSPFYPPWFSWTRGQAHYKLGDYEEALRYWEATRQRSDNVRTRAHVAIANVALGRKDEARAHIAEALRISPNYTIRSFTGFYHMKDQATQDRMAAALREAGLPPGPEAGQTAPNGEN